MAYFPAATAKWRPASTAALTASSRASARPPPSDMLATDPLCLVVPVAATSASASAFALAAWSAAHLNVS
jgi:hypothetical protein